MPAVLTSTCLLVAAAIADAYALGSASAELQRLAIQHNVFAGEARSLYAAAGFKFGDALLDLGCGPGTSTFELSHIAGPRGTVLAVDSSSDGLASLRNTALGMGFTAADEASQLLEHPTVASITLSQSDAVLPFAASTSVDGLWCRWLLTWIDASRIRTVLRHTHDCLVPGGTAIFWDYFNDCAWGVTSSMATPMYDKVQACLKDEWRQVGDPCVASKLPAMLSQEGFELIGVRPISPIVLQSSTDWIWPTSYFYLQVRRLAERGLFTEAEVDAFDTEWDALGQTQGSFYCPPTMAAFIARRPVASTSARP